MKQINAFVFAHPYFTSYLFVYGLLQIGLITTTAFDFAPALFFLFFLPFVLFYFGLPRPKINIDLPHFPLQKIEWFLFTIGSMVAVLHLLWLGKIPFLEAWQAPNLSSANLLRKIGTTGLPKWLHYANTWSVRVLLPTSALFFLHKKNKIGCILSLSIGCLYGLALLQKSLLLWVSMPIFIYCILHRKWFVAFIVTALSGSLFILAIFANNPQLHGGQNDLQTQVKTTSKTNQVSEGLLRRILIVPGQTLGMWFKHVPHDKPYLYGRDFGLYTKLTGQKTADYNLELYATFYPEYAKQGIKGSVNTAHFMRAYTNFGWWILPISAGLFALFLRLLNIIHRKTHGALAFSLQIFPLLLLSSGSLLTLLFSGGWALLILLLIISQKKELIHV
jgi:hypothetical protein